MVFSVSEDFAGAGRCCGGRNGVQGDGEDAGQPLRAGRAEVVA